MALRTRPRRDALARTVDDAHANWQEPGHLGGQALTAAATRIDLSNPADVKRVRKRPEMDWQQEAWHHWERCGELQYASTWMANSLSRIRIYAAEVGDDGRPGKPTKNKIAKQIAHNLFGGPGAAAQSLAALGVHLTVPGDAYVICESRPGAGEDDWYVASTTELQRKNNGTLGVDRGDGWRALAKSTVLIRVWNPHPRRHEEATSATRSALPVLRELEKLDDHVYATLESRLPAGILFVPDTVDFLSPDPEQQAALGSANALMTLLTEVMLSAVEDKSSPAALVPIIAKVPPESLQKIQHITFGADLIAAIGTMREACIRRLALSLDMPPEELLGQGDSSHWSSWQIEESGVKVHVEPKAITIVAALTSAYYRPALRAAGITNPEDYVLWYDVSELVLRPNRADMAKELHAIDAISVDVLMREAGFDPETDKPSDEEFRRRVLLQLLDKEPLFAQVLLEALGITDVDLPLLAPQTRAVEPTPDGGVPVTEKTNPKKGDSKDHDGPPTADEPKGQDSPAQKGKGGGQGKGEDPQKKSERQSHTLLAGDPLSFAREIVVESLVSRGLEYANKKLLTRGRRGTFDGDIRRFYLDGGITVTREQIPRLLEGAFTYLGESAGQVGLDAAALEQVLIDHIGGLLVTGEEHQRQYSRVMAARTVDRSAA